MEYYAQPKYRLKQKCNKDIFTQIKKKINY